MSQAGVKADIFRPSTQFSRFKEASKKMFSPNTKAIANNSTQSFGRAFSREFGEEMFEESLETAGENIYPVLWGIITIINCLSGPNPGKIFQKHNVAWWLTTIEGTTVVQQMTYNYDNIRDPNLNI